MPLAKNFVTQKLPKELGTSKTDQIDLLNKSFDFFKDKDTCDIDDFTNNVMVEPDIIEKFYRYKQCSKDKNGRSYR